MITKKNKRDLDIKKSNIDMIILKDRYTYIQCLL